MHRAAHAPFLSHRTEFAALVDRFLRGVEIHERIVGSAEPARETTHGAAVARPAAKAMHVRPAKKKRMKARARKKLKASSR
jgi:hypothetical protein